MTELPDGEAVVVGYLADHDEAQAVLGVAADGAANVTSDDPAPPWPACRVYATPASSDRLARWDVEPELQVELWDAPDEADQVGPAELNRRLSVILQLIFGMPDRDYGAGEVVVSRVTGVVGRSSLPDPTSGQPRRFAVVRVVMHPPMPVLP